MLELKYASKILDLSVKLPANSVFNYTVIHLEAFSTLPAEKTCCLWNKSASRVENWLRFVGASNNQGFEKSG